MAAKKGERDRFSAVVDANGLDWQNYWRSVEELGRL
jgi:hypothetical protein